MRQALLEAGVLREPHWITVDDCKRKVRHRTVESALSQAEQLCRTRKSACGVYYCRVCTCYHLSHILDGSTTVACVAHWLA